MHGTLEDNLENIVFGYGDEMDPEYSKIEAFNINEFLRNFKSFYYFKNDNYQLLHTFMTDPYEVIIMGHSCGISDRVLLNAVFENDNCIV